MADLAGGTRRGGDARIRPAGAGDLRDIREILASYGNDHAADQRPGPDMVGPYIAHLIARHRTMVSELPGSGVVAFGVVADTGRSWHLADLFTRPDQAGRGLGRPLLAELFGDRWPRTTFSSGDPRALPTYVRAGMAARWVALYMRGGAEAVARAALDPRARALEVTGADPSELASLELGWTGADRSVDHAYWGAASGSDPFLICDEEGPVALGYGHDMQAGPRMRVLERLAVRPGAPSVGPVLLAVVRSLAGGDALDVTVPGPHPALPVLLEMGFRIADRDTYCAGPDDPVDATRDLPNPGLL